MGKSPHEGTLPQAQAETRSHFFHSEPITVSFKGSDIHFPLVQIGFQRSCDAVGADKLGFISGKLTLQLLYRVPQVCGARRVLHSCF
jgi:hypothetical protein